MSCPDGVQFVSNAEGSKWEEEATTDGGLRWRILLCPAGYEMRRDPLFPELDECVRCVQGFYTLQPFRWQGINTSLQTCHACPNSATCSGGTDVQAKEGFWRLTFEHFHGFEFLPEALCSVEGNVCMFPKGPALPLDWGEEMRCRRLDQSERLYCARQKAGRRVTNTSDDNDRANILICPLRACGARNMCLQNRTGEFKVAFFPRPVTKYPINYFLQTLTRRVLPGPLCGYCKDGYSMTTQGCSSNICPRYPANKSDAV
jgi:hypothetical protein